MNKIINKTFSYLQGDRMIWLVVMLLFMVSMLVVYSSTGSLAYRMEVGNEKYLFKQLAIAAVGILLMYGTHRIDYKYYSRIAQLLWLVSIPLLLYTTLFGMNLNGAGRWLRIPFIGLTFQTSDLAKLALIMFLARQLSAKQDEIKDFKSAFLPILLPIIITSFIIAPDNLSTSLILFATSVFVMFIGRIALKHIFMLIGTGVVFLSVFVMLLFVLPESVLNHTKRATTWKHRIENFKQGITGAKEDGDEDYQALQAKIAIAKGGLIKVDPGGSEQKNFLPHSYSDFIFSIIIEEYGLLGGAIVVCLYLFLLYRCIRIVIKAPKAFGALLAAGLGIALVVQAMIHMAVSVNLVPVTGVTLPLISMGGSSVIFTSIAFGIILSVSRDVERRKGNGSGMSALKVIISGGGTGGHIFPAVAIANEIKRRQPDSDILFVGANGRMEMEKVPQAGYPIKGLTIAGFQRGSIIKNLTLPFKIIGSLFSAYSIVNEFKPDVAVGVGGYASGPLLRAAGFAGVPTVIQEQNSFAGITNKLLAKGAKVICTGYEGMEKVFPKEKIVVTGNPVRAVIATMSASRTEAAKYFGLDENKKTVFITGGSLGARTLNQSVIASKERIKESDVQFIWQTGKVYFEDCVKEAGNITNLKVMQFVDRMDYAYTLADIVISRAGALSISELQIVGKPVILVPSPNVTEDHQTHNAMELVKRNAAVMIKDNEAKLNLIGTAYDLLEDEEKMKTLGINIKQMAMPDAAERIVDEILKVIKQ